MFIIIREMNASINYYAKRKCNALLRAERIKEILEIVKKDKVASVNKLAGIFNVHRATIRRDLADIEERGLLVRIHGGIIDDITTIEPPFSERSLEHYAEKERIGLAASELIGNDEHIIIDSGTTTLHIAKNLHNRTGLTIITNDMNIASELRDAPGVTVIVTGGTLRRGTYMLNGMFTHNMLQTLHVQKAFIGIPAIHPVHGLTHSEADFVSAKQWMIKAAKQVIVTVDHSKIGKLSLHNVMPTQSLHIVITGEEAPDTQLQPFKDAGITIIKA
jgi:DeoR family fructose operon transcriptional repressor